MKTKFLFLFALIILVNPSYAEQKSYKVEKLSEHFFAAISKEGGSSSTNAFFFLSGNHVIAGGAHMSKGAVDDLWMAIDDTLHKPVKYFVLTHHHPGYSHIDTSFPTGVTVITSGETWGSLEKEKQRFENSIMLFSEGLTIKTSKGPSLVLSSIGPGHSDGDSIVIIPEEKIAYVGDILYVKSVGYMGNGHMRSWLQNLDLLSELGLKQFVPGYGPTVGIESLNEFRIYFRDFLSEVLTRIEKNDDAATIKKTFILPKYKDWSGYLQFLQDNAEHAWSDLKNDFSDLESP